MPDSSVFVRHKRAPAGAPPGTILADEGAAPTLLRLTRIDDDAVHVTDNATIADVEAALAAGGRLWLDVAGLRDTDLVQRIGDMFGVNPLAVEDIVNTYQRPKAEFFDRHAFVVLHMMEKPTITSKEQYAIVFGDKHVTTFQEQPGDCLDPVRRRLASPPGRIRRGGPAYLSYAIIDTIIDNYFPLLEAIGDRLEALEPQITANPLPEHVTRLHEIKRELLVVKRALWPTRDLLSTLMRDENDLLPPHVTEYYRDTYDHVAQLIDIVETYRELASGLLDLYLSNVSTRMNEVMKVLTIISTIFIPLGFLAGIWGMNFDTMPELHLPGGYFAALAIMFVIAVVLTLWFRWRRWL